MPIDELFIAREVDPEIPKRAKIFPSVQSVSCGERVAEHGHVSGMVNLSACFVPESTAEGGES